MRDSVKRSQYRTRHVSNYLKFFALGIRFIEKFNGSRTKFRSSKTHLQRYPATLSRRVRQDQSFSTDILVSAIFLRTI